MANNAFLQKMKNGFQKQPVVNNFDDDEFDDNISNDLINDQTFSQSKEGKETNSLPKEQVENIMRREEKEEEKEEEQSFHIPELDINNPPEIKSINIDDIDLSAEMELIGNAKVEDKIPDTMHKEEIKQNQNQNKNQNENGNENEEEHPVKRRKPGPKPKIEEEEESEKEIETIQKEQNSINIDKETQNDSSEQQQQCSNDDVAQKILTYVRIQTIINLANSYKSDIYTENFTSSLFESYIEGHMNPQDPLFKELITECINNKVQDPYLKENTELVLKSIIERGN